MTVTVKELKPNDPLFKKVFVFSKPKPTNPTAPTDAEPKANPNPKPAKEPETPSKEK